MRSAAGTGVARGARKNLPAEKRSLLGIVPVAAPLPAALIALPTSPSRGEGR